MLIWTMLLFASGDPNVVSSAQSNFKDSALNEGQIVGRDVKVESTEWSIQSETFSYSIERSEATFVNNVLVEHEAFVLKANKVTVQGESEKTRQILAEGDVHINMTEGVVTSTSAIYLPEKNSLRCSGSVKIESPKQIVTGDDIEIELKKEIRCRRNCSVQWK